MDSEGQVRDVEFADGVGAVGGGGGERGGDVGVLRGDDKELAACVEGVEVRGVGAVEGGAGEVLIHLLAVFEALGVVPSEESGGVEERGGDGHDGRAGGG